MNSNQLSTRLQTVASFIAPHRTFADIGSDHAYLPCYAVKNGLADRAIAGEVVEGPYQSACRQVQRDGLTDVIDVRKGNGLAVMEPGEADAVTIAGMGGPLIATILEEGKQKLHGVQKLVLQPNIAGHAVRQWLENNEWTIEQEAILEEDGQVYEVISAIPGQTKLTEQERLFGPVLIQQQNDAFRLKWNRELEQTAFIMSQLDQSGGESAAGRKKELEQKQQLIKDVLEDENTERS